MGFDKADLGMTHFALIPFISNLVDFTPAFHYGSMHWFTAKPRQLPHFTNLIRIFDLPCWLLTFASIATVCLFLGTAKYLGARYGAETELSELVLIPFR